MPPLAKASAMPKVLYLSRTGMLEPLGQSQVVSYLRGLSKSFEITLISYERDTDLANTAEVQRVERLLDNHGIHWIRRKYRNRPRLLAVAINLIDMFLCALKQTRKQDISLIHARAYIAGATAWVIGRLTKTPFIFDMRSLWAEELVTSNRARRGSLVHRAIVGMERLTLRDAAIVISLTRAGAEWLSEEHAGTFDPEKFRFIPTCTDTERFVPGEDDHTGPVIVGCHGSILSGWFRPDILDRCYARMAKLRPDATFEIVTREDPDAVRERLAVSKVLGDRLQIFSCAPNKIHQVLASQDLSVFFYQSGAASELGRSPTRMGEALACGVPVLTNGQVGDVEDIVRRFDVGTILADESDAALHAAVDQSLEMIRDPAVGERCRNAAEAVFSLDTGTEMLAEIYTNLILARVPA